MASNERWVPTIGYELVKVGDGYHVYRRGGVFVRDHIPDDEVALRPYAAVVDYDAGVAVLRSLRATLGESNPAVAEDDNAHSPVVDQ